MTDEDSAVGGQDGIRCFRLNAVEIGGLRIASGFRTDRVYELSQIRCEEDVSWRLLLKQVEEFQKAYDEGDPADWLEPYYEQVKPSTIQFLGASRGAEPEALLTYAPVNWNDTLWLLDIRVAQNQRRAGLGTALIEELQRAAREKRVRGIFVESQINNVPAIHLYRKCGFEVSGFNDHLYENDDAERQDVAIFLFWETSVDR